MTELSASCTSVVNVRVTAAGDSARTESAAGSECSSSVWKQTTPSMTISPRSTAARFTVCPDASRLRRLLRVSKVRSRCSVRIARNAVKPSATRA